MKKAVYILACILLTQISHFSYAIQPDDTGLKKGGDLRVPVIVLCLQEAEANVGLSEERYFVKWNFDCQDTASYRLAERPLTRHFEYRPSICRVRSNDILGQTIAPAPPQILWLQLFIVTVVGGDLQNFWTPRDGRTPLVVLVSVFRLVWFVNETRLIDNKLLAIYDVEPFTRLLSVEDTLQDPPPALSIDTIEIHGNS
jgi:hypothetical protein